jgi:rhodanese-related sulfurtransferase
MQSGQLFDFWGKRPASWLVLVGWMFGVVVCVMDDAITACAEGPGIGTSLQPPISVLVDTLERWWRGSGDCRIRFRKVSSRLMDGAGKRSRSDSFDTAHEILISGTCGKHTIWKGGQDSGLELDSEVITHGGSSVGKAATREFLTASNSASVSDLQTQCGPLLGRFGARGDSLLDLLRLPGWIVTKTGKNGEPKYLATKAEKEMVTRISWTELPDSRLELHFVEFDVSPSTKHRYFDFVLSDKASSVEFLKSYTYESSADFVKDGQAARNEFKGVVTVSEFTHPIGVACENLRFLSEPADGTRVHVADSDWLHHEWRDGKVVQVTDPDAMKRLEEFKFANEGIAWRKWLLMVASLGLIAGAIWLFRRKVSAAIFFAVLSTGASGWADEGTSDSGVHQQNDVTVKADSNQSFMGWDEPYCGIVSAFAVLKHFHRPAEFRDLISVDFVGSWEGSSGVQIQDALRKYGVDSTAIGRSTPSTLQACLGPVILHTRSRTSPLYRHWVVYFGQQGDAFRILDPSLGMMTMSAAELQSQWDGLMIAPAQSLPAKPLLLAATLSGIQKHQTLVLFCQSEHCAYDELVARRMIARGFTDVRLYHGGYAEWRSTVENAPESASLSAG